MPFQNCFEVLARFQQERSHKFFPLAAAMTAADTNSEINSHAATPMTEAYLLLLYILLSHSHKMLEITILQLQVINFVTSTEHVH